MDDAPSVDALEGEGVLKHKDPKTPSPQKIVSVQQTTQEEYSRRIQEGLINKAYRIFGWALFLLFAVFCIGQAKEYAISLLRTWLANYKFEDWNVPNSEKTVRAEEIANELSNNSRWLSHGRPIDIHQLRSLKLKLDDFGESDDIKAAIRTYYSLTADYVNKYGLNMTMHTKGVFIQ